MSDSLEKQKPLTNGVGPSSGDHPISKTPLKATKPISVILNPLYEIFDELKEDIFSREKEAKYPIGLKAIDDLLWGLHKKHLVTIGARTSQGKSAFAINMMKNLADTKKKIIFFSLEMSKTQILERLLCSICNINNIALQRGECREDVKQAERVFEDWINSADILIDDQYGYNFDKVEEICELIRPDFIFIDYIQMISVNKHRNKLDAIEDYVRRLKQISMSLNFGAILLSQINRGGAENPSMSAYKGAGVLEEHCLDGDTLIYNIENGVFYKIRDIYDKQKFFPVKTIDMETGQVSYKKPNKIIDKGELECYKVTTKSGKEIIVSEGTLFYNQEWRKVEDLSVGDEIYVDI